MICPNEQCEMQPVKVESHYGQTVMLDQCPECGGLWFDSFELYMAKPGQAEQVEALNAEALRTPAAIGKTELLCPRDRAKLVHFTDPLFPKEIIIERCPYCGGFWLNRGEFTKYQQYRQKLQRPEAKSKADQELEQHIREMLDQHKTGDDTIDSLGRLGRFLSTPVDPITGRPLEPERLSEKEERIYNLILNVLNVVLSVFLRR